MRLSEQLKRGRIDRPDEWTMDRYIQKAAEAEQAIRELVAITEDMSNGKDVGHRLIVAWDVADEILEDNDKKLEDVREAFDTIKKRLTQEPFERREFIATWIEALRSEIFQQNQTGQEPPNEDEK